MPFSGGFSKDGLIKETLVLNSVILIKAIFLHYIKKYQLKRIRVVVKSKYKQVLDEITDMNLIEDVKTKEDIDRQNVFLEMMK